MEIFHYTFQKLPKSGTCYYNLHYRILTEKSIKEFPYLDFSHWLTSKAATAKCYRLKGVFQSGGRKH